MIDRNGHGVATVAAFRQHGRIFCAHNHLPVLSEAKTIPVSFGWLACGIAVPKQYILRSVSWLHFDALPLRATCLDNPVLPYLRESGRSIAGCQYWFPATTIMAHIFGCSKEFLE